MPVIYTKEQQTAIHARGGSLLVSAAAGSGKTAVLTERILQYITNTNTGIDQLLVVTFTEAAAAEMRERIALKIAERQAAEPYNLHLSKQAALLPSADISTIHAFCRKLLKQHFQQAGLDPAFKVGDETELALIKSAVMDELFEEEYAREDNAVFTDLSDAFGGRMLDDRLDNLIRDLFAFIENEPYPEQAAQKYVAAYGIPADSLDALPWAAIAREELVIGLTAALEGVKTAKSLCLLPSGPDKYLDALITDEDMLMDLLAGMDKPFHELYRLFNQISWTRLPAVKIADAEPVLKEQVKDIRDKDIKGRVQKLAESVFFAPPEKMLADIKALKSRVEALMGLALRFRQKYAEEKQARNILDFNDLEHYAVKILDTGLFEAGGYPYKEVLIDEYQDSNEVQELILQGVAGDSARFMVGDVKQSIYRFRRANPGLFIEKMKPDSETVRTDLTQNFRSRAEVLDAVNFFFSQLLSPEVGEVDYGAQAMLYKGAEFPPGHFPTVVELVDGTDEDELSNIEQEARVIARNIHKRLGRPIIYDAEKQEMRRCRPGDIVVLVRGVSSIARELTEALKQNGVNAAADLQTGFFDTPEIKTALAFLRTVDNPRQDIDLLTVLHSPVYAFTPDELAQIRDNTPEGDYFDALLNCNDDKVKGFLNDLNKWRKLSAFLPVSRLLNTVYDDTRYPAHAGALPGGAIRQANLRLLMERAIQYEETTMKGLFHFMRFIEGLQSSGGAGSVSAAQASHLASDRVRIMTVHKAKGLEFPIVFVSMLGKKFNREDERKNVILHPKYGLGLTYTDLEKRTKSNTLARYACARLMRRENLSEELRVLYVAMTRAKEQLILTGCVSGFEKKTARWSAMASGGETLLPLYCRRDADTFLDWLIPCLARHRDGFILRGDNGEKNRAGDALYSHPASFNLRLTKAGDILLPDAAVQPSEAVNALTLTPSPYPYEITVPSKLSISEIKRIFASDVTPDSTAYHENREPKFDPPDFIRETQGMDARRMGTAMHTVAEHTDVHTHRNAAAIDGLLTNLVARNLLTGEEANAIDPGKIETFMNSLLAKRMRAAARLYREIPFVMEIPAREIYGGESGETLLVHGIIDCYFEEDGGIVLVDYKSDAVYGNPYSWANTHRVQLDIYKKAVEQSTAKEVKEVLLYSFWLGEALTMENL